MRKDWNGQQLRTGLKKGLFKVLGWDERLRTLGVETASFFAENGKDLVPVTGEEGNKGNWPSLLIMMEPIRPSNHSNEIERYTLGQSRMHGLAESPPSPRLS